MLGTVRTVKFAVRLLVALAVLAAIGVWQTGSQAVAQNDPIVAAHVALVVEGSEADVVGFARLKSLTTEVAVADSKFKALRPVIVLERALDNSLFLETWHEAARAGAATARKNASLVIYNDAGEPVIRYYLINAVPVRIEVDGLKAGAGDVLIQTVTFLADGVQRVST